MQDFLNERADILEIDEDGILNSLADFAYY